MNSDSNSIHQTRLILPDRLTSHRTGLALALFLLTVLIPLFLLPPFPAHAQDPVPLNTVGDWFSLGQDSAYSMAWGDVDGDGDLDLAIGNDKRPNQLYLNVGGNLNLVWTAATTHTTTSVAWGDVDGDGDLDLAVGNDGQPNQLYLNQGLDVTGALSMTLASWSPSEAHGTTSVAWGDVDGDGDLDLAAGNSGSANKVYLNQNGVLQTAADNPWSSNEMDNTTSVVWGDVDGDGDLDLAVGNSWQPNRLYLNQGLDVTGALSMTLASWSPSEAHGTTSVAWGDGDGDGDLDLVVGNDGQPNQLYLNWGGRLENSATWTSSETDSTTSVAWGDVDSDGDLDLAVGNLWPQPNRLYLNQGRALQIDEAAWSSSEAHDTRSVAWGDVDGDGDLDLVAGSKGDQVNRLYLNQGSALQTNAAWSSTETEVENAEVAWGDVDGDGDLDLAVGNTDGNRLYLNQGGRLENNATQIGEAGGGASLAWGDVDGDSDLDLATASWGELTRLYMNQGIDATGALSMTLAWSSAAYPTWSVAWGDVDGDGDLDLAVGNDERPNRLYLNQGGALQQTAVWTSTEADSTASVAWGDVDGDGDLDLAVGNGGWHSLESNRLYLNDGGALQTSAAWSSSEEDKTYAVAWGDVDGDGDLDLAVGNFRQPNRLYLNQGGALQTNAAWSSRWIYETESLAWGDVDGDGDLDLAVASWNEANRLHLNQGGVLGTTTAWSSSEADTTYGVAWGDVDGDGDLDLAASGDQPSRLYLNRRQGGQALSNNLPAIGAGRPYSSTADFYAQSGILASPTIPLTYTLFDPEGDPVGRLATLYSLNGGGQWFPAVATTDTITTNLRTGRLAHYGDQSGPQSIPDNTGSPLNASILVTDSLDLAHVAVWLIITHTNNRDLAVTLQSPAGTQVPLFSSDSLTGSNLIGTVFDDQAATPIISGTAPFTGTYRPEGNLAAFQGQSSSGTWTLLITDTMANGYTGTLAAWGMRIRTAPVAHVYNWDIFASGFFGQSDNVVMRLVAYPQAASPAISGTYRYTNTVAGPFQRPYASATSFPFRVRGTQVRVYSETVHISNTVENAMVYRLPADQPTGGFPLADSSGTPFRTDQHGYLQGRGEIGLGDQLFAMAPVYTAPDYGGALVFDGVADYVDAGSQITLANSSFTVAFWAKRDGINDYDFVVGQGPENTNQGLHIGFRNNNAFTCAFYYNDLNTPALSDTDWHHWACSYDAGTNLRTIYRDGVQVAQDVATAHYQGSGDLYIGRTSWGTLADHFGGLIDEIRIWDVARTQPEIQADMNRALCRDEPGLVAYWPFDDPSIAASGRCQDQSGNGNDGTLVGAEWLGDYLGGYTVYHTSGTPTEVGVDAFTVTVPGVQVLTVTAEHPLILFDIDVSLEWDAHNDPRYLDQLEFDLNKASKYLYDFTNGQVALGHVNVFQNADNWASSHVVVQATNRLRPFAAIGGVTTTLTVEPDPANPKAHVAYGPGQVRMGATWNRYGNPGYTIGVDWPLILAHELSHYFLFLFDVYLGLNEDNLLVPWDDCTGSAMGDVYVWDNTEFVYDADHWNTHCADTLANRTLGRTEWETIELWYPWLHTPVTTNTGPIDMPFDFTTVTIFSPTTEMDTLEDPTFYLDYQGQEVSSSRAHAFLLRDADEADVPSVDDFEYVYDLGSPTGGQNRLLARGAQPGDRLCVFDQPLAQYGCEVVSRHDERLDLVRDESWTPVIQISPVNSTTFHLLVGGLADEDLDLHAKLYPEYGSAFTETKLYTTTSGLYTGTLTLAYPAMNGHVQVWVSPTVQTGSLPEAIVGYSIGGNPGTSRAGGGGTSRAGGGGTSRAGGGGTSRAGGGGSLRAGEAPLVSPDGQMILYHTDEITFTEGEFYTIQNMAGLPHLPPGRTLVGQGYNLVATAFPTQTNVLTGSISFQYLGNDVLVAGADESDLSIYFWDGDDWTELDTVLDTYYNMASAPSQGPGVYALMASVKIALYGPGWNLVAYPVPGTRVVTEALRSIEGSYAIVYGYVVTDTADPWRVHGVHAPPYVNRLHELRFGQGYWISATQAITWYLGAGSETLVANNAQSPQSMQSPPATYYGPVVAGAGFTPAAGMAVAALIDGNPCGQARTMESGGEIVYSIHVFADGPGGVAGCGMPDRQVTFWVGEQAMSPAAAWDNNRLWELALQPGWRVYLPLVLRD